MQYDLFESFAEDACEYISSLVRDLSCPARWYKVHENIPDEGQVIIVYGKIDAENTLLSTMRYAGKFSPLVTHWVEVPDFPTSD